MFERCICAPLSQLRPVDDVPVIVVVDAIDEAEFHRPESSDSIGAFLLRMHRSLPDYIRLLITVRTDCAQLIDQAGWRRLSLDEAALDERVARDARLYIDRRLAAGEQLRRNVAVTTGLTELDHPLLHFAHHLALLANGNLLYLRLTLDLLEQGIVRLKTANYSALPVSLPEVQFSTRLLLWGVL